MNYSNKELIQMKTSWHIKSHQNTHSSNSNRNSSSSSGGHSDSRSRRKSSTEGLNESGMNKLHPAF